MVTAELEEYSYSLRWIFGDDEQHELNAKYEIEGQLSLFNEIGDAN
ncbi:TPA: hypothetical protein ACGOY9_001421 [Streptococcus suis]